MSEKETTESARTIEFVSLTAGGQGFCIEITLIREIRRWSQVTALPFAEDSVLGVMNLRGAVIPIVDLAARLGLGATEIGARNIVVVTAIGSKIVGLVVDSVSEILSVNVETIRPNPTLRRDGTGNHVVGLLPVDDVMLRVLDLETLFAKGTEEAA
ncbi:chemotaxis protein CheW [Pararhodobacter zhoushanensis]|uniref:Chemotaxis protein CheW n=1 Tax=Pararhodobacter zhoushanensis TaxID=2479545 RepID=A0ABT3GWY3_9RHOB|nr:chemotaxis protein CheW [Pararhodobacter zhoushanensis]MCW1932026.1 chemotaxis protein CheW [Pararhodobacter zhoushanensis]